MRDVSPATPAFTVARVTGTLGAEIGGLDLRAPLPDSTVDALSAALVEHKVLFFRDQALTTAQHLAFARRFGPLEIHPFTENAQSFVNDSGEAEVLVVESTAENPHSASAWHSDVTWRERPSLGSILHAIQVPAWGGDTLWADMCAAYAGLDDATRQRISALEAVHDWHVFRRGLRQRGVAEARIADLQRDFPPVVHPLVRTHPISGAKAIYVNRTFTIGIQGMTETESAPLLERLYALARVPEYQVRFRWQKDSIAFWDNRSTQHYAVPDFFPQHRRMERVTVAGDRPF